MPQTELDRDHYYGLRQECCLWREHCLLRGHCLLKEHYLQRDGLCVDHQLDIVSENKQMARFRHVRSLPKGACDPVLLGGLGGFGV